MARILLVEPYLGGSHAAWASGWMGHSRHELTQFGYEGRHWRWRMRGASVSLAREIRAADPGPFDVVVVSNMLDLASFVGLARDVIGSASLVQYFHENQLSYPRQPGEPLDTGLAWMQWRGALVADELWWNSAFHRDSFFAGVDELLGTAPDHDHRVELPTLTARSSVIHPGIWPELHAPNARPANERPLVVSNQRWHHDKDVGAVVRAFRRLLDSGVEADLAVVGDPSGGEAERIDPLLDELGDRVVARGWLGRRDYVRLLRRADVVVSAARGENFGIAVVEAVAAGAWPVLPRALSYPEIIPSAFHDECLYDDGGLGRRLQATVAAVRAGRTAPAGLAESMTTHAWPRVTAELDDRIDVLCGV